MRKKLNGRVLAGLAILSVVLLVALLAPVLAPHDPYELGVPYLHPSAEHPLGTNDIGQDILSELIYGTRISLLIGVVSALAVTVVGTALGILSGYLGGWTDRIIMQVTNVVMALPSDWPTTLGTLTALLSLPFDTTMFTVPSALSLLPLDGVWLMTTPSSTVSEYCWSTVT